MTAPLGADQAAAAPSGRGLHVALWVVQALLFVAFTMAGSMKLFTPFAELGQKMPWVLAVGAPLVRFIGLSELSGALGLLLPSLTRIRPALTPLAATGLVVVMLLAMAFHVSRGEPQVLPANAVLGGLAAFVAWGRRKRAPIAPR
jgi:hypothetical protein